VTFVALLNHVAVAAFVLIFLIMLFLTRSLMAALVIPGTVAFSYAGAFGLSVLVWQHLIGLPLHWLILPLTFIILVAVGSDYNLPLIIRVKEELHAGLHTSLIRALGSTGGVVTSSGLVFAFTMLAMLTSNLRTIGQVGSTVCIALPARHSDRAFVRRAVHSQNPRAVVLVANPGVLPSATAAMRALSEIRSPCAGHAPHASTPAGCPFRGRPHRDRPAPRTRQASPSVNLSAPYIVPETAPDISRDGTYAALGARTVHIHRRTRTAR
jgi:hypothetical protein